MFRPIDFLLKEQENGCANHLLGIGEGTLRLSIGLEDADDLITGCLRRALKRASA